MDCNSIVECNCLAMVIYGFRCSLPLRGQWGVGDGGVGEDVMIMVVMIIRILKMTMMIIIMMLTIITIKRFMNEDVIRIKGCNP